MPPLGWPGGLCHTVERIQEEVVDQRLEDQLTDKVEKGQSLTNPEAAKVYEVETERGVSNTFSRVKIGPHAQLNCGVYVIRNRHTSKVYVGRSTEISERWAQHKRNLRGGRHDNPHLQSSWNLYGEAVFEFEVLQYAPVDQLPQLEGHYCQLLYAFDRHFGYNVQGVTPDGSYFKTPEHRAKISQAHKGKHQGSPSEETKAKIRETLKKQRAGVGNPAFGKPAHNRKAVRQLSLAGAEIQCWGSVREAASALGCDSEAIARSCKGKSRSSAGFRWEFLNA